MGHLQWAWDLIFGVAYTERIASRTPLEDYCECFVRGYVIRAKILRRITISVYCWSFAGVEWMTESRSRWLQIFA